jgi:hypothetical protein
MCSDASPLRTKTTPELIMRSNNLPDVMLRIGQKLMISPAEFSLIISKKGEKVIVLNGGKFFKQYPIQNISPQLVNSSKKPGCAGRENLMGESPRRLPGRRRDFA